MKVALDATVVTSDPSGARARMLALYPRISRFDGIELFPFVDPGAGLDATFLDAGARVIHVKKPPGLWQRAIKSFHPAARGADLEESFDLFAAETLPLPRLRRIPQVATVHDLRFLIKGLRPAWQRIAARLLLQRNLARARLLITVSTAMKRELESNCPSMQPDRIRAILNGAPSLEKVGTDKAESLRRDMGIKSPYILYIGHLEPRKNLGLLVSGFSRLCRQNRDPGELDLVLAGRAKADYAALLRRQWKREAQGLKNAALHLPGAVGEAQKAALLEGAMLAVQPSRYEGFGLGVLEALSAGVPLACSDIPSHREIASEGALYFSPDSAGHLCAALEAGMKDGAARSSLAAGGKARAAAFSWDRSAEELAQAWEEALR